MTRRTPNQTAGKVKFVRPDKDVDEHLEGFVFLALEMEEVPPAQKRRTRKTSTARKTATRPPKRATGKQRQTAAP
jgi:hypothetical protein